MKNWRTTLIGILSATLVAVKPILDGSGYHFDTKTVCELAFAVTLAVLGVLAKDQGHE